MSESFLENSILALGKEILTEVNQTTPPFFSREYYTEKLMQWAVQDEKFKNALFKLVEVLPALSSDQEIVEHIEGYLTPVVKSLPWFLRWSVKQLSIPCLNALKSIIIRQQVNALATRFIMQHSFSDASIVLRKIRKRGMAFTLDLLGESVLSDEDAKNNFNSYLDLMALLHREIAPGPKVTPVIAGHVMNSAPFHLSLKLSALYPRLDAISREKSMPLVIERLSEILIKAKASNCSITIDMEDYALKDYTLEIVEKVFLQQEFSGFEKMGIVMQAYLKDTEGDLYRVLSWVNKRKAPITVRLVKGAYWDFETKRAKLQNWPAPVWQKKETTDFVYEKLTRCLLDHHRQLIPAIASHNIRSLCHAVSYAQMKGIDKTHFELQGLYGMADPIKAAFVRRGYLVREYVPVGELLTGMAYLVRRLLENTANQGFLRLNLYDHESPEKLLAQPSTSELKPKEK